MSDSYYTEAGSSVPTPASGYGRLFLDSFDLRYRSKDVNGFFRNVSNFVNGNTGDVTCSSADTYLTGSSLAVPTSKLQVLSTFAWDLVLTKSGAGTAASPTIIIRVGTGGTTSDAARITFTSPFTQTANADSAYVRITAAIRTIGASGVMHAGIQFSRKNLTNVGFNNAATSQVWVDQVTSGTFDTTTAALIVGLSCNPGATGSPVWTFQSVQARADNL